MAASAGYPLYTPGERLADGIVHVTGVGAGLIAVAAMLAFAVPSQPAPALASLAVYGATLIAMFACSAAYNMVPAPRWKGVLRRFDHAAIFLKIAGTYTPFAVVKMEGLASAALLGSVWTVALLGAIGKLVLIDHWERTAIALYLALGWVGVLAFKPLAATLTLTVFVLLGLGGVLYSLGVIFHVWRSLPYQNAIWHVFVLAATACHFAAVVTAVLG